eukprot:4604504-Prymnesium_polylepis.2
MQYGQQQQFGQSQQQSYDRSYVHALPAGWVAGVDDASGQTYYFHEQTGQSQWETPQVADASTAMRATALYAYRASTRDELSLQPGDAIVDVMHAGKDWCTGTLRDHTGFFPASCVDLHAGRAPGDQEIIQYIAERLREPQVRIVSACVDILGSDIALNLLARTEQVQAEGGMVVPDTGMPRTGGGIYFKLLKDATHLPRDAQDAALLRIKREGRKVKSWEKAVGGWS